jgi:hypothetical protein
MVQKWVSDSQVLVGETITVHVNITNISDDFAYNLTIQEPVFNSLVFDTVQEYEEYIFVKLGYGANFYYEYTITADVVGEYTLESTRIDFLTEQGFAHRAISAPIPISVTEEIPQSDIPERWNTLLQISLIFIAIPIIVFYLNKFVNR